MCQSVADGGKRCTGSLTQLARSKQGQITAAKLAVTHNLSTEHAERVLETAIIERKQRSTGERNDQILSRAALRVAMEAELNTAGNPTGSLTSRAFAGELLPTTAGGVQGGNPGNTPPVGTERYLFGKSDCTGGEETLMMFGPNLTTEKVERTKQTASAEGWHSFRDGEITFTPDLSASTFVGTATKGMNIDKLLNNSDPDVVNVVNKLPK
jgi:hypothetical protein